MLDTTPTLSTEDSTVGYTEFQEVLWNHITYFSLKKKKSSLNQENNKNGLKI